MADFSLIYGQHIKQVEKSIQRIDDFKGIKFIILDSIVCEYKVLIRRMRNKLLDQMGNKIQQTKQTLTNLFKDCQPETNNHHQINFQDVLLEKDSPTFKDSKQSQLPSLSSKIQQAIRNSTIAKAIYHQNDPQKLAHQCIERSQILKDIENQISINNISQILELKKDQSYQEELIQITGVLSKFSPSLFGGWSERYCTLTKNKFVYHENKNAHSPLAGFINFNILSFSAQLNYTAHKPQSFEIKVDKGDKKFVFKGENSNQTLIWFQKIQESIESSEGKANHVTALSNYHRFWRKEYVTQKQFEKNAQTGDILLFRGKKTSALLQRALSGQQYDHVGVILKNTFNQILIFEANGGFGVGICPWKKFIKHKWFQDQEIIAIRHLKVKRSQQFLSEVTKFVGDNIGKQYKFSLKSYLITRNSEVNSQKTSYFCSSLVAKLYKKLGLLDPIVSSSRYMPYNFSDKEKIVIASGKYGHAELQRQKIIVFDKKPKNKIFQKTT